MFVMKIHGRAAITCVYLQTFLLILKCKVCYLAMMIFSHMFDFSNELIIIVNFEQKQTR